LVEDAKLRISIPGGGLRQRAEIALHALPAVKYAVHETAKMFMVTSAST
jgi:hypothetical protein